MHSQSRHSAPSRSKSNTEWQLDGLAISRSLTYPQRNGCDYPGLDHYRSGLEVGGYGSTLVAHKNRCERPSLNFHPETFRELRAANPVERNYKSSWTAEEDEALRRGVVKHGKD